MFKLFKILIELIKYGKKRDGLIDQRDDRNFGSRAIYKPDKADLEQATKETFIIFSPKLIDQIDSDHCVGEGGAYEADATEDFDGESGQGSGSMVFACAKKWSGANIYSFGTSLLAGCMARVTWGICNKELFKYKRGMRNWFSNFANIPKEAFEDAKKHKAGSAWQLDVPWDWSTFNAIVATMWNFKAKRVLIGTGNNAHRVTVIGYDKKRDCLICADTYGNRTFNNGIRFINRDEAKTLFTPYFVIDIERELAEILVAYNNKLVKIDNNIDCYLIKNGEKHLIPDEKTAWSNGFLLAPHDNGKLVEIIPKQDLDKIPKGEDVKFGGGKNEWIIRRILEKYNLTD